MKSRYTALIFAVASLRCLFTGPLVAADQQVIKVSAKKFDSPEITLKKACPW